MTEQEVIERNKLIAEFMELEIDAESRNFGNPERRHQYQYYYNDISKQDLEALPDYHSYWDWLMPVVEKIEDIDILGNKYGHSFNISNWEVLIKDCQSGEIRCSISASSSVIKSKIEATWLAVVEFIKWYNTCKE